MAAYNLAIVTFFDILGFKEIVKTSKPDEIAKILDWLGYVAKDDVEPGGEYSPEVVTFSDSVVRTQRIDNQEFRMGLLYQETLNILWAQMELSYRGVLIRGAMTIGEVTSSPDRVFGPGLIEAYELESKTAQYPRVVVSSKALRMLDESNILIAEHHPREVEKEYVKNMLRLDSDGVWFIDYLRRSESEVDDPGYYVELLIRHRDLITKNLKSTEIPPADVHKYTWLAQYYNSVIDQLKDDALAEYETSRRQLKVDVKDLKPLYEF